MALITSPTESIPDLNYEYHTVTIDTIGQDSANTFTCYLSQPLKNIVQARLLTARINTSADTEHCYVSIKELDSIFSDRASNVYDGQASLSMIRGSFASLSTTGTPGAVVNFRDEYSIATQYIDPIRRLDRLTVTIRNQDGETIERAGAGDKNFLVLRFVCRKLNL
jgi:hypothetical protein|tara:strand:+ start:9205 stop:9702 length:498 start_codon:yes stop_codon:yes gene_type:complete